MSILETILLCVMILWVAYDQRMMNRKIRKLEEFADQHLLHTNGKIEKVSPGHYKYKA